MSFAREPQDSKCRAYSVASSSTSMTSLTLSISRSIKSELALISESLTLDSISSASSMFVPPFPSGYSLPLSTILSVGDHLHMFPKGTPRIKRETQRRSGKVILTSPTSPRLKAMIRESLCITKWADSLPTVDAPGHTPWGGIRSDSFVSWVPEGSLYAPEFFSESLSLARRKQAQKSTMRQPPPNFHYPTPSSVTPGCPPFPMPVKCRTRQTICKSSTEAKNALDLVPIANKPRCSDHFLQERVEGPDSVPSPIHIVPPSLTLSNSCLTIPLSLDSSSNLARNAPTLAVRRGKKTPAPLRCKQNSSKMADYPSIPTAFLGSPSTYVPQFEHANCQDDVSLGVEEMINNLRLQCAAMVPHTPSWSVIFDDTTVGNTSLPLLTAISSPLEGDESSSVDDHEQSSMQANAILPQSIHSKDGVESALEPESATVAPMNPKIGLRNNRGELHQQTHTGVSRSVKHPPSTPLPLRPAIACCTASREGVQKHRKTVRFATSPAQRPQASNTPSTPNVLSPTAHQQRLHTRNPSGHRRSLSRQIFILTPEKSSGRQTPVASTPINLPSRATSVLKAQSPNFGSRANFPQLKRRSLVTPVATHSRDSTVLRNKKVMDEAPNHVNVPLFRRSAASLGRQSLSYIMKGGKENHKQKPLLSTSFSYGCQQVDDCSKSSTNSTRGSRTLRSRMPVPLRNILTRFTSEREYPIITTVTSTQT